MRVSSGCSGLVNYDPEAVGKRTADYTRIKHTNIVSTESVLRPDSPSTALVKFWCIGLVTEVCFLPVNCPRYVPVVNFVFSEAVDRG